MGKSETYREILLDLPLSEWEGYLLCESGLPGPRGNLELAQVVADLGDLELFQYFLTFTPQQAPTNNPAEFLAFCGVVGLGCLVAAGNEGPAPRNEGPAPRNEGPAPRNEGPAPRNEGHLASLRLFAADPRWRIREGVAMALQRIGQADMGKLLLIAEDWSQGGWLEKRAVIAGLAEPALLKQPDHVRRALQIFDQVTESLQLAPDRKNDAYRVLRQGLGYGWSVLVAALPADGIQHLDRWMADPDPDIRWVMRENLKKKRLLKAGPERIYAWREALA